MKAKEYYAKYSKRLMAEDVTVDEFDLSTEEGREQAKEKIAKSIDAALNEIFMDFTDEITNLLEQRKCKTNSAAGGVVSELNDKWNAMIPMFMKEYKFCPIKHNAVNRFWANKIPGLENFLRGGIKE